MNNNDRSSLEPSSPQNLQLRQTDQAEKGLWQQAWEDVRTEVDWELPANLQKLGNLSAKQEIQSIQECSEIPVCGGHGDTG